jgi:hypothetical protein
MNPVRGGWYLLVGSNHQEETVPEYQPKTVAQAASEMAEIILESLADYGDSFHPDDLRDIVDSALAFLPVHALAPVIVERLGAYGDEEAVAVCPDVGFEEASATFARIAWAEVLPEVDSTLPLLDGTNPPREPAYEPITLEDEVGAEGDPPTLIVRAGKAVECSCEYCQFRKDTFGRGVIQ